MAILLITHDLGVVAENADVVAVMYAGRIVEYARVEDIFDTPQHPYTQGLLASIPRLGHETDRLNTIAGTVPSPAHFPSGCRFHPRCPRMQDDHTLLAIWIPALREVLPNHWAACHHVENFAQKPITKPQLDAKRSTQPERAEHGDRRLRFIRSVGPALLSRWRYPRSLRDLAMRAAVRSSNSPVRCIASVSDIGPSTIDIAAARSQYTTALLPRSQRCRPTLCTARPVAGIPAPRPRPSCPSGSNDPACLRL